MHFYLNDMKYSIFLMLTMLLAACSSDSPRLAAALKNPAAIEALEAKDFLTKLHASDQLPGFYSNDRGQMTSGSVQLAEKVIYPFSVTYHFVRQGDTVTNSYTAVHLSKDSPWKLQKAWKVDSKGQIIEEWPIK